MRTLLVFLLLLAAALLLGAVANYPMTVWLDGRAEPHQISNTLAKLAAVPLVALAAWYLGVGCWRAIGYNLPAAAFWRELAWGWLAGVAMMVPLLGLLLLVGVRVLRPLDGELWETVLRAALVGLVAGLIVAVVEETFIRGVIYSSMRREAGVLFSVVVSSLYFAGLHFISPPPLAESEYGVWQGLTMLADSFTAFYAPWAIVDAFIALTMAGVLLALVREVRGGLAFVIGMHAGWVVVIKVGKSASDVDVHSPWLWGIGSYDEVSGWISVLWVVLLLLGWWGWRRAENRGQQRGVV